MTAPRPAAVDDRRSPILVVSAHPGDFVWRAGGAIALSAAAGQPTHVVCLSFGERGESAKLWQAGHDLEAVKRIRRAEAEEAAEILGAEIRFLDVGDYPLVETPALLDILVGIYREIQPAVVITHGPGDPYNADHPAAGTIALKARQMAQAPGVPGPGEVIGAPPVYFFEPHQTEVSGFRVDVLLDITPVWETKRRAMEVFQAQRHLWDYYIDVAVRRGAQLQRNSGPNDGATLKGQAEAFTRLYPQVVRELR
jgi:4-oxalomesaconate hydratase